MKTFLQTLFFFLLATHFCLAQWYQQNSGTGFSLHSVHFEDINIGWTVGSNGTILKTTNGGTIWTEQLSGTTGDLRSVSFTDTNNGTAVGGYGTILRTTDGGTTWTSQTSGTNNLLWGVSFTDVNTGTAVGELGTILRTTNGGTDWTQQVSGITGDLRSVSFTDASNGWAAGGFVAVPPGGGIILRTTNSGINWITQIFLIGIPFASVCFTDTNNGWAVGIAGTILKTTDGGNNWSIQSSGDDYYNSVCFIDANTGWVVGGDYYNNYSTILRTTDGGQNWVSQLTETTVQLYGVSFTDANNGTAVGEAGLILRTTNGGVPVELTSFTATSNGKEVILNWSTATELNNQGFEIERSEDNISFNTIGFVPGFGTTTEPKSYSYSDQSVNSGTNYYRLKQVDYDGSYEYSDVVEVEFQCI